MTLLRSIAPKWKEILMKLRVQDDQILSIENQTSDDAIRLNTGLSKWLNQSSPMVTLPGLTAALTSPEVGETDVASEIIKGKFRRYYLKVLL